MTIGDLPGRPKILFVTSHWPMAPAYGAQQRVLHTARLLSCFGNVSLVIVPTEPEDDEIVRRSGREFHIRKVIRPTPSEPGGLANRISHRIRHELDPTYMATDLYQVGEQDRTALLGLMEEHDLTWVHTIRAANWFRIYRWPGSVLDVDDLPSRIFWSEFRTGTDPVERLLDLRRWVFWQRREQLFRQRFDVITVCSEDDRQYLGGQSGVHVFPNGFSPLPLPDRRCPDPLRLGFLGNCGFVPNQEGIRWFIGEVWPRVKRDRPHAQLRLVGRGTERDLPNLGPDIQGLGWVEDPTAEIDSWAAMIVPIKVGSGTRVKVAEAFARKCPVIATAIGIFGYDVEDGKEVLLADRPADFATACSRLLRNPEFGEALSARAYQRFLEEWTWDSFKGTIATVVQECLGKSESWRLTEAITGS